MAGEIDTRAFRALSCGLYIVTSLRDGKKVGCVVNTFNQVTSKPARVSVAVNKENFTAEGIRQTGRFEVVALTESATMEMIGAFGFHSSADMDKFAEVAHAEDRHGIAYPTQNVAARFSVVLEQMIDVGTHWVFIGAVEDADATSPDAPMTYAYYHQVKGGKTPPKASSYNDGDQADDQAAPSAGRKRIAWRCKLCGYIEYIDELPDDFKCPICGVGKDMFERIEVDA